MAATTLSASTTTTPASRPSPKRNETATKSRSRPASHAALGDWGIPGGPEVYSTRCPPLPRLRMLESKEIVHRAVLRAKGLDPDLVPSPSGGNARGPRSGEAKKENGGAGSPRGAAPPTPRTDLGASSFSRAGTPRKPRENRENAEDTADDALFSETIVSEKSAHKKKRASDLFLEDVELETLLPKSRGGVGGGGGGDFTRGVGATHFLRVRHEVTNARLERRVRLALVDPEAAPEVDAVDVASEIPGVRIVPRGAARRGACADAEKKTPGGGVSVRKRGLPPGSKAPSPYTPGGSSGCAARPNAIVSASASRGAAHAKPRLAPSAAFAARAAAASAAGNVAFAEKSEEILQSVRSVAKDRSRHQTHSGDHSSDSLAHIMSPRDARVSASLRALVAEAPTHVAAAVDDVAAAAARKEMRESRAAAARVRFLADARNAACDRNTKLVADLERLNDELVRVRQMHRRGADGSKASGSTRDALRAEIGAMKTFADAEAERAKTREHVASRLRETVSRLKRGVDASRETIANECEPDVAACRAYADDALRLEQRAVAALEWIKKKYLLKANSWKKDLETQKAIREALAEELRELRAAERRRGARDARARAASEAFMEVQREKEDSDNARRDLETRSEDAARSNMIRLAVAVGLARPETRAPAEIVSAVNGNERRRAEALAEVKALQIREAETSQVLLERRERLRRTRLGVETYETPYETPYETSYETRPRCKGGDADATTRDAIGAIGAIAAIAAIGATSDDASSEKGQTHEIVTRVNEHTSSSSVMRVCSTSTASTEPSRDVEHRLGVARRTLARKFKRFRDVAARLVAVDEGLKKIDDAVARTKTRVIAAFGEGRSIRSIDRRSTVSTRPPTTRPRFSTLGRSPIEKGRASPRASTNVYRKTSTNARAGPPLPLGRPSVGGRAAEAVAETVSTVSTVSTVFGTVFVTTSAASPSRRASTPVSPSASVGGDERNRETETGRPGSAVSARSGFRSPRASVSSARPPRVSRADPFGVFDRLSRPRASASPRRGGREKDADADAPAGADVSGARRKTLPPSSKARVSSDNSSSDDDDSAASAATRALATALPARFEATSKAIFDVLGSIPRGADGSPARASVVLGGARDKVSGGLRGGLAGYPYPIPAPNAETRRRSERRRPVGFTNVERTSSTDRDASVDALRALLCARPGKVPVAAGEVDDDPARMRLKRGRAYCEMAMKWCFRAGRPIADEEDSGDELHAVAGEDGVLRFAAEHDSVEGTVPGAYANPPGAIQKARGETETGAGARQGDQSQGDAAAAGGSHAHVAGDPHAHAAGALDLARAANVGLNAAAFRKMVARTRKAGVVPTRADLKKASRRAEEKKERLAERAKKQTLEAEE